MISDITRIELLGWPNTTTEQLDPVKAFISKATSLPIGESVILKTITLRQTHRIKLGDSIIAATALVHGLSLVTRTY